MTLSRVLIPVLVVALGVGYYLFQKGQKGDQGEKGNGAAARTTADDGLWLRDFAEARERAKKENKDILMEFTGSDWCPPCMQLHENVLSKKAWAERIPEHFVLLKLDNPRDTSKVTRAEQKQYQELKDRYDVQGVPTIILADDQGRPYAVVDGYDGSPADKFIDALLNKVAIRKKRDEAFAKAEAATGTDRAQLLANGLADIDPALTVKEYRAEVETILREDPNNEAGLKTKFGDLLRMEDVRKRLTAIVAEGQAGKPEDAVKAVDEFIASEKLSGVPLQESLYIKAVILYQTDKSASKKTLEAAAEAAPDTERARAIREVLSTLFKDEEKPKEQATPEN